MKHPPCRLAYAAVCAGIAAIVLPGCGAKQPPPPSKADIQADIARLQNDPNLPAPAKAQAIRQDQVLLNSSK